MPNAMVELISRLFKYLWNEEADEDDDVDVR